MFKEKPAELAMTPELDKSYITLLTNTLKASLSAYSSSLRAFMISKTHIFAQKSRGRQLNSKVAEVPFFYSFFFVQQP